MSRTLLTTKNLYLIVLSVVAITLLTITFARLRTDSAPKISNFDECAKHFPIMESYPAQCSDGKNTYVQPVSPILE